MFWPWHVRRHGDVKCLLLLDNCTALKDIDQVENYIKPPNLTTVFFPPNLTSRHQPADMCLIAVLKVGYKRRMLQILLDLYNNCDDFDDLAEQRKEIRKGCRGIHYDGKATILDAMGVLNEVWIPTTSTSYSTALYSKRESVIRCWRKASILPPNLVEQLNILDPLVARGPPRCRGRARNTNELPEIPIQNPNPPVATPAGIPAAPPAVAPPADRENDTAIVENDYHTLYEGSSYNASSDEEDKIAASSDEGQDGGQDENNKDEANEDVGMGYCSNGRPATPNVDCWTGAR